MVFVCTAVKMGLTGSSVKPVTTTTASPPSECPMHKSTQSSSTAASTTSDCPVSFGKGQPVMSEMDIDPTNMVGI